VPPVLTCRRVLNAARPAETQMRATPFLMFQDGKAEEALRFYV
jgi:hypothetical protein